MTGAFAGKTIVRSGATAIAPHYQRGHEALHQHLQNGRRHPALVALERVWDVAICSREAVPNVVTPSPDLSERGRLYLCPCFGLSKKLHRLTVLPIKPPNSGAQPGLKRGSAGGADGAGNAMPYLGLGPTG